MEQTLLILAGILAVFCALYIPSWYPFGAKLALLSICIVLASCGGVSNGTGRASLLTFYLGIVLFCASFWIQMFEVVM